MKDIILYINEALQLGQDNRNKKFEEIVNKGYEAQDAEKADNITNDCITFDLMKQFAVDIVSSFADDIVRVEFYQEYRTANFGWDFYGKRELINSLEWHNSKKEWEFKQKQTPYQSIQSFNKSKLIRKFIEDNKLNYIKNGEA